MKLIRLHRQLGALPQLVWYFLGMASRSSEVINLLLSDGSLCIDSSEGTGRRARFRLSKRDDRGETIAKLTSCSITKPEMWEGVLLRAFLQQPEIGSLEELDLHQTDFHNSMQTVAAVMASAELASLRSLSIAFSEPRWRLCLAERPKTSIGKEIDWCDYPISLVSPETCEAFWRSLPALRELDIAGGGMFPTIDHSELTHLRMRGNAIGSVGLSELQPRDDPETSANLPNLQSLHLIYEADDWGGMVTADCVQDLDLQHYTNLQHLDLRGSDFDISDDRTTILQELADLDILPMLRSLGAPKVDNREHGYDHGGSVPSSLLLLISTRSQLAEYLAARATANEASLRWS